MDILMSIRKPYTGRIFDGTKPMEFRTRIGKNFDCVDTIYIYETKRNSGSGSVIGSVKIKKIIPIPKMKMGTYFLLPYYVDKYGTDEEKETVKKAMDIELNGYSNSLVLSYLFQDDALSYMKETGLPPEHYHTYGSDLKEYNKAKQKENDLCERCDCWGRKIGFYDEYDESYWKFAIQLENPVLFKIPMEVGDFRCKNGNRLKRAPQGWCYVMEPEDIKGDANKLISR